MAAQMTVPELAGLTEKQEAFVRHYVENGGYADRASVSAGYAQSSTGWETLKIPHVQAAVHAYRSLTIRMDLGTLGLRALRHLLTDDSVPSHVLLGASKLALSLAGHCEPASDSKDDSKSKPLSEMTLDELKDYVAKGKVILDAIPHAQAVTIEAETSSPPAKAASVE